MTSSTRVRPRVWIGLAIYVGYVTVFTVTQKLSGVSYDDLGLDGRNLFVGAGLGAASPLAGISVIVQIPAFLLAIIAVGFVIRGSEERHPARP